ncbi:hypothetical protein [Flavobacterium sp. XS1P27]|uniref:hypothetical protein n=1 Tax=Flavobacterium sp. XS1P27 TaxID=3401724 RepID=UPI003AB03CEE
MTPKYDREISYSFKEYEQKYDSKLQEYLCEYEDFGVIYFIEKELEFYSKCFESSCISLSGIVDGSEKYVVNKAGTSEGLIQEIKDNLLVPDGNGDEWDFELSIKYQATFKRIINFLENLKQEYLDNKISLNTSFSQNKETEVHNQMISLFPRIFTNGKAFYFFENLREEFGNGKTELADYSFVFHRMKKDKLIFDDLKQTEFIYFLLGFGINIDRIKSLSQIGNNDYREGIYNRVKDK